MEKSENEQDRRLEAEDVYLRSEELQEVLGRAPNWVVRSGIFMVAVFFVLLTVAAYFIRSYDMVPCPVQITTEVLPASVEARQSGKISQLFVEENQQVKAHQPLAIIQSTSNYSDVLAVSQWLADFENNLSQEVVGEPYTGNPNPKLGTIMPGFTQLQNAIEAYHFFVDQAFLQQQQQQLRSQIQAQENVLLTARNKEQLAREALALTEKNREGERSLYEDRIISEMDNNNAQKALINERLQIANLEQEQALIRLRMEELQQRVNELGQLQQNQQQKLLEDLRDASSGLSSAIAQWEEDYILQAPIAGQVSFFQFWSANQEVNAGDEVMVIIPDQEALLAYAYLPVASAGKVETGQNVRIELADFPAQEFGYVMGQLISKSSIARDGAYLLKIDLTNGLKTRQYPTLTFSQEMEGVAQIIVRDENLLQRLFRTFRNGMERAKERTMAS